MRTLSIASKALIADVTFDVTKDGVKNADGVLYDEESFGRTSKVLMEGMKRNYAEAAIVWSEDTTPLNKHRIEEMGRKLREAGKNLAALREHVLYCEKRKAARNNFQTLGRRAIAKRGFEKAMLALFAEVTLRHGNGAAQAAQAHFESMAFVAPVDAP